MPAQVGGLQIGQTVAVVVSIILGDALVGLIVLLAFGDLSSLLCPVSILGRDLTIRRHW